MGVVAALLLISVAVLGMCMLPRCPLRKVCSPYKEVAPDPDHVVGMDEESGRGGGGGVEETQEAESRNSDEIKNKINMSLLLLSNNHLV